MGKSIKKWMCYTNPFTDPETWAGFEVSHSYPFCLISLCQGLQTAPALHEVCAGGIIFSSIEWIADWDGFFVCQHEPAQVQDCLATLEALFQAASVSSSPATSHDGCWGCYPTCLSMPFHSLYSPSPSSVHQLKASCQADIHYVPYSILKATVKIDQMKDRFTISHHPYF